MAYLKNGYKVMYEQGNDIKVTKTSPATNDPSIILKDYTTGATIDKNSFYEVFEINGELFGTKKADGSFIKFLVYSSTGDLLLGKAGDTPIPPEPETAIYKHTIVMHGTYIEPAYLTLTLYSTTNETLTAGSVNQEELFNKVVSQLVKFDSISFDGSSDLEYCIATGFNLIYSDGETEAESVLNIQCEDDTPPMNFILDQIISDTVED